MTSKRIQNWLFLTGLGLAALAASLMGGNSVWSPTMKKHMTLGFHDQIDNPILAIELAGTKEDFDQLFDRSGSSLSDSGHEDKRHLRHCFITDFIFIVGYTAVLFAILARLWSLGAISHRGWMGVLGTLILGICLLDIAENCFCLSGLSRDSTVPTFNPHTAQASYAKWFLTFVTTGAVAYFILQTLRPARSAPLSTWWCLAAILLVVATTNGLLGCLAWPILIQPGFQFLGIAILPLALRGWWKN